MADPMGETFLGEPDPVTDTCRCGRKMIVAAHVTNVAPGSLFCSRACLVDALESDTETSGGRDGA